MGNSTAWLPAIALTFEIIKLTFQPFDAGREQSEPYSHRINSGICLRFRSLDIRRITWPMPFDDRSGPLSGTRITRASIGKTRNRLCPPFQSTPRHRQSMRATQMQKIAATIDHGRRQRRSDYAHVLVDGHGRQLHADLRQGTRFRRHPTGLAITRSRSPCRTRTATVSPTQRNDHRFSTSPLPKSTTLALRSATVTAASCPRQWTAPAPYELRGDQPAHRRNVHRIHAHACMDAERAGRQMVTYTATDTDTGRRPAAHS